MGDRIARFQKIDSDWVVRADQDVLEKALKKHGGRIKVIRGSATVKIKLAGLAWKDGKPYGIQESTIRQTGRSHILDTPRVEVLRGL